MVAASTGWSVSGRNSRHGSARGSWRRRPRTPAHWIIVDGQWEIASLTAHIVASVRERLGDAPASAR